jgi:hypothetical protein
MQTAEKLVQQFERMVRRDGGSLALLGVDGNLIRVGYAAGADADCADGACVLPHRELEELMGEALARYDRTMRIVVEPMGRPADGRA